MPYQLLGLARKAGKVVMGETVCKEAMYRRKAGLVILAKDLNETTKKKMIEICEHRNISYLVISTKEELSACVGKSGYGVFAVTKKSFARAILEKLSEEDR